MSDSPSENISTHFESVHTPPVLNLERTLPNNTEAEAAVLGSMFIDADAASAAISALKFDKAFFRAAHQTIFNAILELCNTKSQAAVDPVVLADHLERNGQLAEIGGREYINRLMDNQVTAANIDYYIDIVRKNAIIRRVIESCTQSITECFESTGDTTALLDSVQQRLYDISNLTNSKEMAPIQTLARDAVRYLGQLLKGEGNVLGLRTGFDFDRMITGLKPGELFVLAARPSIGKTALALNIATNIAMNNHGVGIFSLEMPAIQLVLRMICSLTEISLSAFRQQKITNVQWNDIQVMVNRLSKANILIDDTGAIDILELRAKARRMVEQHKVEVIFIDYLQLVKAHTNKNASRENEVSMISGTLKAIAKELNIPVVALAQLNRTSEQTNERPQLSNLRESGAIEQDADVVAILHRDRKKQYEQNDDKPLEAEVIIAKNRNGATGTQPLLFKPRITKFINQSSAPDAEPPAP